MKVLFFSFFLRLFCVGTTLVLMACSSNNTEFKISSLFAPTWDFSESSQLSFDSNYVEIKDGTAQLRPLDLETSSDEFSNGNHFGTSMLNGKLGLRGKNSSQKDITSILPEKQNTLIGYWKFENSVNDTSFLQQTSAALGGVSFLSDSIVGEKSLNLDGTDDAVEVQYNPSMNVNHITVSFWAKIAVPGQEDQLVSKDNSSGGNRSWQFRTQSGGVTQFVVFNDSSSNALAVSSQRVDDNLWHHIVGVYDGSNIIVYVDGIAGNSVALPGVLRQVQTNNLFFGRAETVDPGFFQGQLDEVAIWAEALSSEDVQKLYSAQNPHLNELAFDWTPKWSQIVGYWKMNGNWQDSSGNGNHGIVFNTPTFAEPKVGDQSGEFEVNLGGFGDYIRALSDPSFQLSNDLSICAWIHPISFSETSTTIVRNGSTTDLQYMFALQSSGVLRLHWYDGSFQSLDDTELIYLNRWTHVCLTRDNANKVSFFVDGRPTTSDTTTQETGGGGELFIGANPGTAVQDFDGKIDDVAIWSTPLAKDEILHIYNRQKQKYAGHYDSRVIDFGTTISDWPELNWLTSLPFGKELVGDFSQVGISGKEKTSDYSGVKESLESELIAYWPFNETALDMVNPGGEDFYDLSGYGNVATETGGISINEVGKLGRSILFDGVDDVVTVTMAPELQTNFADDFTVSTWVKVPLNQVDTGNTVNRLWIRHTSTGFDSLTLRNQTHGDSGKFDFRRYDGTASVVLLSIQAINDSEFHHILSKKEGGQLSIYIDGQLHAQTADTSSLSEQFNIFRLGRNSGGTSAFSGNMDETAVWKRALSDAEVQQIYRRGGNRVKFQVKSCIDPACECKSFSTSPLGTSADCDGDAVANALDFDDIRKAKFIGPGGEGTTYYSELLNRKSSDLSFNCGLNSSDSDANICVEDEIILARGPKPSSPLIDYSDFPLPARPLANRYFQYRSYLEADKNSSCSGSSCWPEVESIDLNSNSVTRYYGGLQEVSPTHGITYTQLQSATIVADSCATFQLSPDGSNYYYWNEPSSLWVLVSGVIDRSSKDSIEDNILQFGSQFGPGQLYVKAFMTTNSSQTSGCSVEKIDIEYSVK